MSTEKLTQLRADFAERGWTLNTRVRKLASGPKRYFRVRGPHPGLSTGAIDHFAKVIRPYYPDVYLTSGSMGGLSGEVDLTFAEGPPM